jgi:hypothetical protein
MTARNGGQPNRPGAGEQETAMLKCVRRVKELADAVGGSLDEEQYRNGGTLLIDAPVGYVWRATTCAIISIAGDNQNQSWWAKAAKEATDSMRMGLDKCNADDSERIEFERDEPWTAPADAPEHLPVG